MRPLPTRLRRALGRPPVRFGLLAVLALLAVLRVEGVVAGARRAQHAWGRTSIVAVATRDLGPGTTVGPDDIAPMARPDALLPADPAHTTIGRVVTEPIARGETVLERRLSGGGRGPAALLGTDGTGFSVPVDPSTPTLLPGDHVDVFAPVDSTSRSAVGATRVAERAVVVAVTDRAVTIGVDATSAATVARALLGASVVLAVVE